MFPITVPPLRERPGDIPMLARYFVERFCRDLKKKPLALSPAALEQLQAYRWPGNVRELQNCIERAVILADGDTILPRHLNLSFVDAGAEPSRRRAPGRRSICRARWPTSTSARVSRSRAAEDRAGAARRPTATRAARPSCCRSATRRCSRS